jgi:hypothetical protein
MTGNLYILATEESKSAVVFDLRKYEKKSSSDSWRMSFRRFGDTLKIPVLPKSQLELLMEVPSPLCCNTTFRRMLSTIEKVYVVGLSNQPPIAYGWTHLYKIFPNRPLRISKVLPGTSHWYLHRETATIQRVLRGIADTELVEHAEKAQVDPFEIFVFRSKIKDASASVLVTGESYGCPFSFFLGSRSLEEQLPGHLTRDGLDLDSGDIHAISAQTWHAFYSSLE